MLILSHPTGNTFVRAALRALDRTQRLAEFCTTLAAPSDTAVAWCPGRVRRAIGRRRFDVPRTRVHTRPAREMARLACAAAGLNRFTAPGAPASIDAVYTDFDRHVAARIDAFPWTVAVEGIYAYEDGAAATFAAAARRRLACVYELPIAYWPTTQRLLAEEVERWPAWRPTLYGLDDTPEKLARKTEEIERADVVVVPSRFVVESLPPGIRRDARCVVAPFGSPPVAGDRDRRCDGVSRPLRVLFAGSMTQRKGLADLFAAMRRLGRADVELVVMGSPLAPLAFYRREYAAFRYEPPRPHGAVLELMRSCDVLALPAIVEGRALVQQEALACGLPLIVTRHAGADDLVEEGRTGFLVPIRDPDALAERIAWFADRRSALEDFRVHTRRKATTTGWEHYEARVLEGVDQALRRVRGGVAG